MTTRMKSAVIATAVATKENGVQWELSQFLYPKKIGYNPETGQSLYRFDKANDEILQCAIVDQRGAATLLGQLTNRQAREMFRILTEAKSSIAIAAE